MTAVKLYQRNKTGTVEIMAVKANLSQKNLLTPDLSAGLEYAKQMLRHMIPAKLKGATLLVEGEDLVVKISPDYSESNGIRFLVTFVSGRFQLEQRVSVGNELKRDDIQEHHFTEHRCRDQINPCFNQARKLLGDEPRTNAELRITCSNLSIRFATKTVTTSGKVFVVKPTLRFPYDYSSKVKDVLQIKCWLEQEMPEKKALLECAVHLLKEFSITGQDKKIPSNVKWVLQGDGECLELISDYSGETYYLIYVSGNVIKVEE